MFFVLLDLILCGTKYSKPPIEIGTPYTTYTVDSKSFNLSKTSSANNARKWIAYRGFNAAAATQAMKKIKLSKNAHIDKHTFTMDLLNSNRCYERSSFIETLYLQSTKQADGTYLFKLYRVKTNLSVISKLVKTKKKKFLGITLSKKVVNEWRPLVASELEQVFNKIETANTNKVNSLVK